MSETKDDELGPYQQAVANLTNKNKFVPLCPIRSGERMIKCKGSDCRWWCADDKEECWIAVAIHSSLVSIEEHLAFAEQWRPVSR